METSIIIPAHNEESNLPLLIKGLLGLKIKDCEIIIVDDNSSDNTGKLADLYAKKSKSIKAVHRKKGNNGMGASLKEGTRAAKGKYIIWVMGDNSDKLETIPEFIDNLNKGYDMVFGSRYSKGGSSGDLDALKAFLSSGYSIIAGFVFGFKFRDITNAFRGFKKKVFDEIRLEGNHFDISPEFAIKAHLKNYRLCEVPTNYKNRVLGQPKFKLIKMGIKYAKLFKYRFARNC
jgi:glycosyltransferase involved in cell wall biosynthesis